MARLATVHSSSGASGVVLCHCAAAAACACVCLTVDAAAAYCTPDSAVQIRPANGFLHNHDPKTRGCTKDFFITWFSTVVDYTNISQ